MPSITTPGVLITPKQLFNFGELDAYAIVFGDFFDQCDCAFAFRAACAEKLDVQDVSLKIKVEFLFR